MKTIFVSLLILLIVSSATGQELVIKIEDDYTAPKDMMWERYSGWGERKIENGMYVSTANDLGAQLKFSKKINQLNCLYSSDMEFTVVNLKGDKKGFIGIEFIFHNMAGQVQIIKFQYNEKGEWQLFDSKIESKSEDASGKANVKEGANIVTIKHRAGKMEFLMNGEKVSDWTLYLKATLRWGDVSIYTKNSKSKIGLDKAAFSGYRHEYDKDLSLSDLEVYSSLNAKAIKDKNLFVVEAEKGYKLMDKKGWMSHAYPKISNVADGPLIRVSDKYEENFGYIDEKGNSVFPIELKQAGEKYTFCSLCPAGEKAYLIKDAAGKSFFLCSGGKKFTEEEGNAARAAVEADAKARYKPKADLTKIDKVFSPDDGMQLAKDKTTRKYGYLNSLDEIVIPFNYESASGFGNNRAPVTLDGRKIYIDKKGVEKINAEKYIYTQTFSDGFAVVQNEQKMYAFIDTSGKLMTGFIYYRADGFSSGLSAVCKDGKYGFLGHDFKPVISLIYQRVDYFSESGLAHVVTMNGKHGYINLNGKFVIPAIYDDGSRDWNLISGNPASGWPYHTYQVKLGGETKYFDATGKDVTPGKLSVEPPKNSIKPEPIIEIKTKTHSLKVYPAWADLFENTQAVTEHLRTSYPKRKNKKPSDIFSGAPDGWIKNEADLSNDLNILFSEYESTVEKAKQGFINQSALRSGLPKDKIKLTEEQVTLADGRKGTVLFYYTFDAKGMVGYYLDCRLISVSGKNPKMVTAYTFFMEGNVLGGDLPQKDFVGWKDYLKKVLLTIKPN